MALPSDISIKSKEIFKNLLNVFKASETPSNSPFNASNDDLELPENSSDFRLTSDNNLLAISCLRSFLSDPIAFTDPQTEFPKFGELASSVRQNSLSESGISFDMGFGFGETNNLIYQLATDFFDSQGGDTKLLNGKKETELSRQQFVKLILNSQKFVQLLRSQLIDDRRTYTAITKQSFFQWHYQNYVKDTPYENYIGLESAANKSSVSWSEVDVPRGSFVSFVAKDGGPFNTAVPTICVVFLVKVENKELPSDLQIINSAVKYLGDKINRTKVGVFLSKVFTHTKNEDNFSNYSFRLEQGTSLAKVCVGFDYCDLMIADRKIQQVKRKNLDFFDYCLNNSSVLPATIEKTLLSTSEKNTVEIIKDQVSKTSRILKDKNNAVQNGPALFFDLDKKQSINNLKQYVEKNEKISEESVIEAILKRQYSLDLTNVSTTLDQIYNVVSDTFESQRFQDPRIINDDQYDSDKIIENIIFYYDEFYNLLGVGVSPNNSTKTEPNVTDPRQITAVVPFEFKTQQNNNSFSSLDEFYSLSPYQIDETEGGIPTLGAPGPLVLVTDYFVQTLYDNFDKINLPSSRTFNKDELFSVDEESGIITVKSQIPQQITFGQQADEVVGSNQIFKSVLLRTSHSFFFNSNEIILLTSKGGIYSLNSPSLNPDGSLTSFLTGKKTFKDAEVLGMDNIQSFLDRFHNPKLLIKPTVPKQKAGQVEDSGKTKPKYKNAPVTKKQKKEKVYDLNDYNSSKKAFSKEVFLIAAQSTNSPALQGLAEVVKSGSIDQIYSFLLTKFPWDDILAKSLLANLRRISNLIDTEDSIDFANKVNACLQDSNIDKILDSFVNLKNTFLNLDDVIKASLPEVPKLNVLIPYVYVLDFQRLFRQLLLKTITEAVIAALQAILGIMLKDILSQPLDDGSLQTLLYDKSLEEKGGRAQFGGRDFSDTVNIAATSPASTEEFGSKNVYVDLVSLIRASRIENLDNVYAGIVELFPIIDARIKGRVRSVAIEELLDGLSSLLPATETKSLLRTVALQRTYNKIIGYSNSGAITFINGVFDNEYNINILYGYLRNFINLELINQEIAATTVITPDPCFINLGKLDIEQIEILKDFLGDQTDDYINSVLDDSLRQVNNACSNFANGLYKLSVNLPSLISDSSKKALQKAVDGATTPIIDAQESSKQFLTNENRRDELSDILKEIYGFKSPEPIIIGGKPFIPESEYKQIKLADTTTSSAIDELFDPLSGVEDTVKKSYTSPNESEKDNFYHKSLNNNYGFKSSYLSLYSEPGKIAPFNLAGNYSFGKDNFFTLLFFWIENLGAPTGTSTENELKAILDQGFETFLNSSFKDGAEISKEAAEKFDKFIDEGGKETNLYATKIRKMKEIIKKAKGV